MADHEPRETSSDVDLRLERERVAAILKAIPDLMFLLLRDGTFIDYHCRDPRVLFVPPEKFMGRTVREVLPPAIAEPIMAALERAYEIDEPVIVEYELPIADHRYFEARIVRAGTDRFLTIVRDVTEAKLATALNRDLAGRLISRQELERQRIARDLHDGVSQQLAVLKVELDQLAMQLEEEPRARLRELSKQAGEIAFDLHHVSYELHPSRLRTIGLVAALQSLCRDTATQSNLRVDFAHGAIPSALSADVSLCVYRIVQEALHNVARHSRAQEATVRLGADDSVLTLEVTDAGVGFDPTDVTHASLGLVSMRERVAILNGQMTVEAAPGRGTRIAARIPLKSPPDS